MSEWPRAVCVTKNQQRDKCLRYNCKLGMWNTWEVEAGPSGASGRTHAEYGTHCCTLLRVIYSVRLAFYSEWKANWLLCSHHSCSCWWSRSEAEDTENGTRGGMIQKADGFVREQSFPNIETQKIKRFRPVTVASIVRSHACDLSP